jgi:hypothetical protein
LARTIAVLAVAAALLGAFLAVESPRRGAGVAALDLPGAHAHRRERGGTAARRQLFAFFFVVTLC